MQLQYKIDQSILLLMTHDEMIRYLNMISNHKDLFDRKFFTELEIIRFINFINKKYKV